MQLWPRPTGRSASVGRRQSVSQSVSVSQRRSVGARARLGGGGGHVGGGGGEGGEQGLQDVRAEVGGRCALAGCARTPDSRARGNRLNMGDAPAAKAGSKRPIEPASKEEQAKNRKTLRELSRKIETDHESLTQVDNNALAEVQCQANEMFEVSKQEARSAALDANLLHGVSRLGAEQAGKLDKQSPEEFVKRLLAKYGVGGGPNGLPKVNFAVLANDLEAEGVFRTVPSTTFLLDSNWAPAAPKEKKQRETKKRTTDEQAPPPRTRLAFPSASASAFFSALASPSAPASASAPP